MPLIFLVFVIGILRGLAARLKRPRKQARRTLCTDCVFVHMQYGATGRNAVFCTFGDGVRPVKLDVLYCTDYEDRNAIPRLVQVGFAPEVCKIKVEV